VFSGDPEPPVAEVRDLAFDGPHGEVPVRVYRPEAALDKSTPSARTLVHFHGGGWTLGTLDSIDGPCRELATRADAVVVSVDYRLAPEHPFPVAVDEAAAAVSWVACNAATFGGDPDRLGVSGTSAGGTLALAAALHAREFGNEPSETEPPRSPASSCCTRSQATTLRPIPTARTPTVPSSPARTCGGSSSGTSGARSTRTTLRGAASRRRSGRPPARDGRHRRLRSLRDDGVALAERFEREGTRSEHRHYPAMAHGFCSLSDRVVAAAETALRRSPATFGAVVKHGLTGGRPAAAGDRAPDAVPTMPSGPETGRP